MSAKRRASTTDPYRCALVRTVDGYVLNVVIYDPTQTYALPAGTQLVDDPNAIAQIGGTWDGATFQPPPAPGDPITAKQHAALNYVLGYVAHTAGTTGGDVLDPFLAAANGTATAAQRDAVIKANIRVGRALATLLHRIEQDVSEEP